MRSRRPLLSRVYRGCEPPELSGSWTRRGMGEDGGPSDGGLRSWALGVTVESSGSLGSSIDLGGVGVLGAIMSGFATVRSISVRDSGRGKIEGVGGSITRVETGFGSSDPFNFSPT